MRDVIILDAGHNALITAWHLAQAGLKPLVLERRAVVGCSETKRVLANPEKGALLG